MFSRGVNPGCHKKVKPGTKEMSDVWERQLSLLSLILTSVTQIALSSAECLRLGSGIGRPGGARLVLPGGG